MSRYASGGHIPPSTSDQIPAILSEGSGPHPQDPFTGALAPDQHVVNAHATAIDQMVCVREIHAGRDCQTEGIDPNDTRVWIDTTSSDTTETTPSPPAGDQPGPDR